MSGCIILDSGIAARKNGKRLPCEVLQAENAKLRELVRDISKLLVVADWPSIEYDEQASECIRRAEELGVEVDW